MMSNCKHSHIESISDDKGSSNLFTCITCDRMFNWARDKIYDVNDIQITEKSVWSGRQKRWEYYKHLGNDFGEYIEVST